MVMALEEKINAGRFVVLGEFEPPKGNNFSTYLKYANQVRGRLDAFVVPEMASAVLKASSLGACALLQREGIETVFQVCCRDRNRLALQADLLAASGLGVKNLMVVSGDDITHGDHPQARTVNDLTTMELLEVVQRLGTGKDMAGIELLGAPRFCTGSTLDNTTAGGLLEIELENLQKKIALGARFFITHPIFDLRPFQQFVKRVDTSKIALIPTVLLLKSAGMARYIDRNIKGVSIPAEMIRDIQKASDKVEICTKIAAQTISRLKEMGMAGVLISTVGWEDKLPMILGQIKS
jgi:methylenetetrahydrofolate reductase (NADPH)